MTEDKRLLSESYLADLEQDIEDGEDFFDPMGTIAELLGHAAALASQLQAMRTALEGYVNATPTTDLDAVRGKACAALKEHQS